MKRKLGSKWFKKNVKEQSKNKIIIDLLNSQIDPIEVFFNEK